MKISVAATALAFSSSVGAFQQIKPASFKQPTNLRAIAIDPSNIIPAPTPEPEEKSNEPFDMTGIAMSVSFRSILRVTRKEIADIHGYLCFE